MMAFQSELKDHFGSAVYLVDPDKLHFTIQGLEELAAQLDVARKRAMGILSCSASAWRSDSPVMRVNA